LKLEEMRFQLSVEGQHGGPKTLTPLRIEGGGIQARETGDLGIEIAKRGLRLMPWSHAGGSGELRGLAPLLLQPAAVLFGDFGDQAAGVLVAMQIDGVELMQQANLQLNHHDLGFEGCEDRQLVLSIAGLH
jgi:hypothetical protein